MVATPLIARGGMCGPNSVVPWMGSTTMGIPSMIDPWPRPPIRNHTGIPSSPSLAPPPDIDTALCPRHRHHPIPLRWGLHSCEFIWVRRRTGGGSSMEVREEPLATGPTGQREENVSAPNSCQLLRPRDICDLATSSPIPINRLTAFIRSLLNSPALCSDDSSPLLTGRPLPSNG